MVHDSLRANQLIQSNEAGILQPKLFKRILIQSMVHDPLRANQLIQSNQAGILQPKMDMAIEELNMQNQGN